jgi:uncharacterized membrane protein
VVHFPIALLLVVPLGLVASLVFPAARRPIVLCTLALMVIGAGSTLLATMTGEAAGEGAEALPQAKGVLERHEELAELASNAFLALTGVYALAVVVPALLRRDGARALRMGTGVVFLVVHLGAATVLARAAHEGGRLVHELGVHAPTAASAAATGTPSIRGEDD